MEQIYETASLALYDHTDLQVRYAIKLNARDEGGFKSSVSTVSSPRLLDVHAESDVSNFQAPVSSSATFVNEHPDPCKLWPA